ncbi:hypothetical protein NDU88_006022 [Pleurodeles waltl]|uniref:Triadin n=1 Tax=Pleurodeles waltl TaxID=8319 RepID=A0AAV7RKC4_PLEWA|nr:hypothetical protein NDU88_006022 [Pleurodeles waltl]
MAEVTPEVHTSTTPALIDSKNGTIPTPAPKKSVKEDLATTFSSPIAWLLVAALIITWSAVAVVMFDLVDYKTFAGTYSHHCDDPCLPPGGSLHKLSTDPITVIRGSVEGTADWLFGFVSVISDIISTDENSEAGHVQPAVKKIGSQRASFFLPAAMGEEFAVLEAEEKLWSESKEDEQGSGDDNGDGPLEQKAEDLISAQTSNASQEALSSSGNFSEASLAVEHRADIATTEEEVHDKEQEVGIQPAVKNKEPTKDKFEKPEKLEPIRTHKVFHKDRPEKPEKTTLPKVTHKDRLEKPEKTTLSKVTHKDRLEKPEKTTLSKVIHKDRHEKLEKTTPSKVHKEKKDREEHEKKSSLKVHKEKKDREEHENKSSLKVIQKEIPEKKEEPEAKEKTKAREKTEEKFKKELKLETKENKTKISMKEKGTKKKNEIKEKTDIKETPTKKVITGVKEKQEKKAKPEIKQKAEKKEIVEKKEVKERKPKLEKEETLKKKETLPKKENAQKKEKTQKKEITEKKEKTIRKEKTENKEIHENKEKIEKSVPQKGMLYVMYMFL